MGIPRMPHYPGSKRSMADWIISCMPKHSTYLKPFFSSGTVVFNKKASNIETINDIDEQIVNLFRVVRIQAEELARLIYFIPLSWQEYYGLYEQRLDH